MLVVWGMGWIGQRKMWVILDHKMASQANDWAASVLVLEERRAICGGRGEAEASTIKTPRRGPCCACCGGRDGSPARQPRKMDVGQGVSCVVMWFECLMPIVHCVVVEAMNTVGRLLVPYLPMPYHGSVCLCYGLSTQ